ncbi:Uncharacterised protein [Pannonibacter phragmitetus]|uniref:Uncharacterized protein n=1 Tax=Pannonibacter phragmitetus TaxID=121719 RepID=A0A378ZVK6_9HYPH|nr:hypothetical protein [Pannonibacter phragmitetus]SUB01272.1 Uncharacterised protein [Pannonibacter phragmitetus]
MKIETSHYPQFRLLCWSHPGNTVLDGQDASDLYERNWRFVDTEALEDGERSPIALLTARYGNGIMLAA